MCSINKDRQETASSQIYKKDFETTSNIPNTNNNNNNNINFRIPITKKSPTDSIISNSSSSIVSSSAPDSDSEFPLVTTNTTNSKFNCCRSDMPESKENNIVCSSFDFDICMDGLLPFLCTDCNLDTIELTDSTTANNNSVNMMNDQSNKLVTDGNNDKNSNNLITSTDYDTTGNNNNNNNNYMNNKNEITNNFANDETIEDFLRCCFDPSHVSEIDHDFLSETPNTNNTSNTNNTNEDISSTPLNQSNNSYMNQIEAPVLQENKSTNGSISSRDQNNNNHLHSHRHQAACFNSDLQDCGFDSCGSDINTSFNQTNSKNLTNTSDYSQSLSYLQQQLHIDNLNNAIHCNRIHLHPHYEHHHNHSPYNNNMTDGNDLNNNNSEFHYHIHHNHNCQPSPMMSSPSQGTDVSSTPSSLIMNMGCTHNHSSNQQQKQHNHNIAFNYQQQNNLSINSGDTYNHINNCQASDGTPNSAVDCICHKTDQQSYSNIGSNYGNNDSNTGNSPYYYQDKQKLNAPMFGIGSSSVPVVTPLIANSPVNSNLSTPSTHGFNYANNNNNNNTNNNTNNNNSNSNISNSPVDYANEINIENKIGNTSDSNVIGSKLSNLRTTMENGDFQSRQVLQNQHQHQNQCQHGHQQSLQGQQQQQQFANAHQHTHQCKCNHNGPVHHHHLHYHDHDESNGNLIHHDLIIPLNLPHHHNHISPNIKDERIKPLKIICDDDIQFDGSENSNINNIIKLNDLSERKRRLSSNNNNNHKCFVSDMNFKKLNLNSNNDNIGNRNHLVQRLPHLHSHNISRGKPRVPHLHNHAHHHGHHHHQHNHNNNHNHVTVSNNVAASGRSTTNPAMKQKSATLGSSSSSSSSPASSLGYSSSDDENKYKIKDEYDELDLSAAQFTIAKPCKWVNKDNFDGSVVDTINDENNNDSHEHDHEKIESKCDGFNFHSNDELYKHLLEDHIQRNHDHDHHAHHEQQQDAKPVVKREEDGDTHLFNSDEHVYSCEWLGCMFSSNRLEDLLDHVPKSHGFTSDMIKKSENDFILTETGNYIPKLKSQIKSENNIGNGTGLNVDEDDHDCSEECHHVCEWVTNQTEVTQNGATPIKCGEIFKETGDLTNHIINKHIGSGKSKYTCCWSECPRNCKEFSQRQKIIRHLHTHTKHKPFVCLECGKKFSLELMLKQHVRTHTGEKPYKCNQCGKFFKTSSSLTIHSRTHTGEKPLICKICGKGFNESSNLNKHMKIHDRNYKCSYCLRSFDNETKLTNHVKNCKKSKSSTTTTTTTTATTTATTTSNSSSNVSLNSSKTVSDSLTT